MCRLPCLGVLLRPETPTQDAKKSRGSRPVFFAQSPLFKSAKRELRHTLNTRKRRSPHFRKHLQLGVRPMHLGPNPAQPNDTQVHNHLPSFGAPRHPRSILAQTRSNVGERPT